MVACVVVPFISFSLLVNCMLLLLLLLLITNDDEVA